MKTCPRCGKTGVDIHTCSPKSKTPRTDEFVKESNNNVPHNCDVSDVQDHADRVSDFAGQLEQELNEARHKAQQEKEHHDFYRHKCSDYIGAEQEWLKILSKRDTLKRERDEWKASHDNQVNLRRALMDRPDLKERAELVMKLQRERDEARSGSNVQCNTAWLETLERSNCYLTTDGKIVQRNDERDKLRTDVETLEIRAAAMAMHTRNVVDENTQPRKVADELAKRVEQYSEVERDTYGRETATCAVNNIKLEAYSQLHHVKEKENTK